MSKRVQRKRTSNAIFKALTSQTTRSKTQVAEYITVEDDDVGIASIIRQTTGEQRREIAPTESLSQATSFLGFNQSRTSSSLAVSPMNQSQTAATLASQSLSTSTLAEAPLNQSQGTPSLTPLSLEALLNKTIQGSIILSTGKLGPLPQSMRKALANIIIDDAFVDGSTIRPLSLDLLRSKAMEIKALFPRELTNLYYIPYVPPKPNQKKQTSAGMLYSMYYAKRNKLKKLSNNFQSQTTCRQSFGKKLPISTLTSSPAILSRKGLCSSAGSSAMSTSTAKPREGPNSSVSAEILELRDIRPVVLSSASNSREVPSTCSTVSNPPGVRPEVLPYSTSASSKRDGLNSGASLLIETVQPGSGAFSLMEAVQPSPSSGIDSRVAVVELQKLTNSEIAFHLQRTEVESFPSSSEDVNIKSEIDDALYVDNVFDESSNDSDTELIYETFNQPPTAHQRETSLEALLKKTIIGAGILAVGKEGPLAPYVRGKLAKIIVDDALGDGRGRMTEDEMSAKAQEIVDLFPGERASEYYTLAGKPGPRKQRTPTGYIFNAYFSKKLRCETQATVPTADIPPELPMPAEEIVDVDGGESEVDNTLQFLRTSGPNTLLTDDLQSLWASTASVRLTKRSTERGDLLDYLGEFPILKENKSVPLFLADFALLYPDSVSCLFNNFPSLVEKMFSQAEGQWSLKIMLNRMLPEIHEAPQSAKNIAALLLLPFMIRPVNILPGTGQTGRFYRPKQSQMQETFIIHISKAEDLTPTLLKKASALTDLGYPFHPLVVLVGGSMTFPTQCLVAVDGESKIVYQFDSVLEAMDFCFKLYHATYTQYPPISRQVWKFLEVGVYKMKNASEPPKLPVQQLLLNFDLLDEQ